MLFGYVYYMFIRAEYRFHSGLHVHLSKVFWGLQVKQILSSGKLAFETDLVHLQPEIHFDKECFFWGTFKKTSRINKVQVYEHKEKIVNVT